jgi:hypothetical protein
MVFARMGSVPKFGQIFWTKSKTWGIQNNRGVLQAFIEYLWTNITGN